MSERRRKRRRFQYSLRTLLVVMLLVSIGMSWLAVRRHRVRRQREAVEAIKELGGRVQSEEGTQVPPWLRELLGDDFFFLKVHTIDLNATPVTGARLEHLKGLKYLRMLDLNGTQVTDAGLEHLKGMTSLQELNLNGTQVTDAGLEHLKRLTSLKRLWLDNTQITDAGLKRLKGMTNLQGLTLSNTQVTDAGVDDLKKALPKCNITR
ncbi:leucine-rich repeat domain-containing protein [Planctomycetota bacterium]